MRFNELIGFGPAPSFAGSLHIGHARGSGTATYNVGAGANLTIDEELMIGCDANGFPSVTGNGYVDSGTAVIGVLTGGHGTVTVDGPGAEWTNTGALCVGGDGTGVLSIAGGGLASSANGHVGIFSAAGSVTVGGEGPGGTSSTWVCSGSLYVGPDEPLGGTGHVTVETGGQIEVEETLTLREGGSLVLGETGGAGTATVTVGGLADLDGTTRVIGRDVAFQADSISFGASHVLTLEITDPNTHSPLSTAGTASLGGSVEMVFTEVIPSVGDSWDFIDAAIITDTFTTSTIPLGPGLVVSFDTVAGGTNGQVVRATVVPEPATWELAGLGLLLLLAAWCWRTARRRRSRQSKAFQ